MAKQKSKKQSFVYSVGRRKSASARVRLFKGKAQSTVNGKPAEKYFSERISNDIWSKPFKVADVTDKYYVTVKVSGGGKKAQAEAVAHGVARTLSKENLEFRKALKVAGLLTRDSRIRERRKVGMGGKARRKKQSPKR